MAKIDEEVKDLFKKVRVKIGGSIRKTPLTDDDLNTLLSTCVEDYATITQNLLIEAQWTSLYGKDITATDFAFAFSTRTFDYAKDYSYWYSKEVGLQQRGPWELKEDFITIEPGRQNYSIPANREINKVLRFAFNTTPAAVNGAFGGVGMNIGMGGMMGMGMGDGMSQVGGGIGGYGSSGSFVMPAFDTMLMATDMKMKANLISGADITYKVTGGPEGTKILHLLSTPGSNLSFSYPYGSVGPDGSYGVANSTCFYTYYETKNEKDAKKCRRLNPDVILTPDQVPLSKIDFTLLNDPTKVLIRQLLVAEAKQTIGLIFGRWSGNMSVPDAAAVIDYAILLEQGKAERLEVITELTERLTRMMPQQQMATMAAIAESALQIKRTQPMLGWVIA